MQTQNDPLTLIVNDNPIYNRLIKNKTTQIKLVSKNRMLFMQK
jgi:hypothetical protein